MCILFTVSEKSHFNIILRVNLMYLILSGVLAWIVLQANIRADCQYPPDPYNIKQIFVLHNGAILTKNCVKVMDVQSFQNV